MNGPWKVLPQTHPDVRFGGKVRGIHAAMKTNMKAYMNGHMKDLASQVTSRGPPVHLHGGCNSMDSPIGKPSHRCEARVRALPHDAAIPHGSRVNYPPLTAL